MSDNTTKKELTPPAKQLQSRVIEIVSRSRGRQDGEGLIDDALQTALTSMCTKDMLDLSPPGTDVGIWTNDTGFCVRLGARIFGVSPESVRELPWQHYLFFTQIVAANFLRCMGVAIP